MSEPQKRDIITIVVSWIMQSRFMILAVLAHLFLFLLIFGMVVFEPIPAKKKMIADTLISGDGIGGAPPPPPPAPSSSTDVTVNQTQVNPTDLKDILVTSAASANSFNMPIITPNMPISAPTGSSPKGAANGVLGGTGDPNSMGSILKGIVKGGGGGGPGGIVAEFNICIGQLSSGGDSLAYMRQDPATKMIVGGSIPNLAEMIGRFSKRKIKALVEGEVMPLNSPKIFEKKPPFIFFTGRRDFKFTDEEITNLRKYLAIGGCIWADNALPGRRSKFDIAFRREMQRVFGDESKFEVLPPDHPVYRSSFYQLDGAPAGVNYVKEPVEAIKMDGIESVIYTSNGYGAMWQATFDDSLKVIDKTVMTDSENNFWNDRKIFFRNVNEDTLLRSYQFGINMVAYLLLRFESNARGVTPH